MSWSLLSNWSENKEGIIKLGGCLRHSIPPQETLQLTHPDPVTVTWANFQPEAHPAYWGLTFSQEHTPSTEAWQNPPAGPWPTHTAEGECRRGAHGDAEAHTYLHIISGHLAPVSHQHTEALHLPNTRKPTLQSNVNKLQCVGQQVSYSICRYTFSKQKLKGEPNSGLGLYHVMNTSLALSCRHITTLNFTHTLGCVTKLSVTQTPDLQYLLKEQQSKNVKGQGWGEGVGLRGPQSLTSKMSVCTHVTSLHLP